MHGAGSSLWNRTDTRRSCRSLSVSGYISSYRNPHATCNKHCRCYQHSLKRLKKNNAVNAVFSPPVLSLAPRNRRGVISCEKFGLPFCSDYSLTPKIDGFLGNVVSATFLSRRRIFNLHRPVAHGTSVFLFVQRTRHCAHYPANMGRRKNAIA